MFALARSSWDDYDKQLISSGGGVWPRSARKIELSPEARTALGTDAVSVTPEQLLHIILLAPVDLFYNGGIGTYIKAASESHEQVKDRANDLIRVDGNQLRCKVVAEGGNLGATQAGRIEFALNGGRIFTDAIDNSAGVDCSDHEVNVKIWLDTEVNAGTLSEAERNRTLNDITFDIEALVLRDNSLQTQLLAREEQAQQDAAVQDGYAALLTELEAEGVLSRELEQLPTDAELARRKAQGRGLTAPELAVVIANVKNRYKRLLAAQPLTEQRWAGTILTPYFPAALVQTRDALAHPLANAILATVLANEVINRCGPLMVIDLARSHMVTESQVIRAWAQAWTTLHLAPLFATLDAHALLVPCAVSRAVDQRTRALQTAVIEGVLSVPEQQLRASAGLEELTRLFSQPAAELWMAPQSGFATAAVVAADAQCPAAFTQACQTIDTLQGLAEFLFSALLVPRPEGMALPAFLQLGMQLRRQAGIDRLGRVLTQTLISQPQQALRGHALLALRRVQQRLLVQLLEQTPGSQPGDAIDTMLRKLSIQRSVTEPANLEQALLEVWALSEAVPFAASIA
jgi:glutamate dehydrogenase